MTKTEHVFYGLVIRILILIAVNTIPEGPILSRWLADANKFLEET